MIKHFHFKKIQNELCFCRNWHAVVDLRWPDDLDNRRQFRQNGCQIQRALHVHCIRQHHSTDARPEHPEVTDGPLTFLSKFSCVHFVRVWLPAHRRQVISELWSKDSRVDEVSCKHTRHSCSSCKRSTNCRHTWCCKSELNDLGAGHILSCWVLPNADDIVSTALHPAWQFEVACYRSSSSSRLTFHLLSRGSSATALWVTNGYQQASTKQTRI